MDVSSSPMVRVTSYDIIFNEVYIKSQLSIILLSRPLEATHHCSSLHDHIYKVPAHYCIMTQPLGVTLVESFYEYKANYKSQVAASMTTRHLGATCNMDIREKYLPIFSFEQTGLTRHHQSL